MPVAGLVPTCVNQQAGKKKQRKAQRNENSEREDVARFAIITRSYDIPRSYFNENNIRAIACNAENVANIPKATGE